MEEEQQQQRNKEEEEEEEEETSSSKKKKQKQKQKEEEEEHEEEHHKTKLIEFLGRTTPIVLQNQNGPCPLLAICNVLLLKNCLNLSGDIDQVSQERLLSLVADRLIDSNANNLNKDSDYLQNQQQNIADAIDLLPRLATGIDVNIKFRRIDDFEFTRECAIFDLLDIPLYHGWIVDPQDHDTANAIGSKSYNTLMGDLVALETLNMEGESRNSFDDSSVDFVAATTATLGVPSPNFSRVVSFEESACSVSDHQKLRKGDMEEEEKLFEAMKLSEGEIPTSSDSYLAIDTNVKSTHVCSSESTPLDTIVTPNEHGSAGNQILDKPEQTFSENLNPSSIEDNVLSEIVPAEVVSTSSRTDEGLDVNQLSRHDSEVCFQSIDVSNTLGQRVNEPSPFDARETIFVVENQATGPGGNESRLDQSSSSSDINDPIDIDRTAVPRVSPSETASVSSSSINHHEPDAVFTSSVDGSEPMYEGEECILDSSAPVYEDQEPMYEGEGVLAEQADKGILDASNVQSSKDELTPYMGQLIKDFLKSNASQLTINGLFCLQDGLNERELCVFFRNNHFSTMFKFEGQLYLLATDQGYINQPDLVWEKLNEVNGNTVFMTGNFKEFKLENQTRDTWNEQSAMTSTADYLATLDHSVDTGSNFNSDLQLAMALQQQEFDEQQSQQQKTTRPPSTSGSSRLVTGPQVPRGRPVPCPPAKQEGKSKEKCIVM